MYILNRIIINIIKYLDGERRGTERLQVVRVEHVSRARAQHLENPDGKPLRVTHRIREGQRGECEPISASLSEVELGAGRAAALRGEGTR